MLNISFIRFNQRLGDLTEHMENVIHKMCSSDNLQVISNLEDIVFQIAIHEFPETWTNALEVIGEYLTKDDALALYGALCALRGIVRRFKTTLGLERSHLHVIIKNAFPILEGIYERHIDSNDEQSIILMTVMTKIFYFANYVVPPKSNL